MSIEIERKFLIKADFKKYATENFKICQGFLSTTPERTVRVRINGNKGFLTVKGIGNETGVSRFEWEKEISLDDANSLLNICEPTIIEKVRYIIPASNNLFFEVDEFHGENKGLIVAEIELPEESSMFEKPEWLGEEITGIAEYYNSMLSKNPYCKW